MKKGNYFEIKYEKKYTRGRQISFYLTNVLAYSDLNGLHLPKHYSLPFRQNFGKISLNNLKLYLYFVKVHVDFVIFIKFLQDLIQLQSCKLR